MISRWLGEFPREQFFSEHFERLPLAQPGSAREVIRYLNWETMGRLLASGPDLLVTANGRLLAETRPPENGGELQVLFDHGISVVIRKAERHDDALRELAESFEQELGGDVTLQVFATPAGTNSFGWHYDCEDVFIAQTAGVKEYFLRRNSVNPQPTIDAMPSDMQFEKETSPLIAATLIPGDWLYIPSGWWHYGRCQETALSLSVGVLMPRARGSLSAAALEAYEWHDGATGDK
jgi:50S ribosomal protein L16 3-hydroxylase